MALRMTIKITMMLFKNKEEYFVTSTESQTQVAQHAWAIREGLPKTW